MKRFLVLITFIFLTTFAYSQNVINLFNKANNFFYYLDAAQFDSAHVFIDNNEKSKITPELLKQIWEETITKNGKIKSLQPIQSKVQGDFFSVTLEGVFENDNQNFILFFNKAENIVGIFSPPKPASYKPAVYADTTKFSQTSTYLGEGNKQLAAILTVPKNTKNFPIVIFVHGSGPSDMDMTVGANKPFKDIAEGLAAQGIASIRYVKRTLVYSGDFSGAFTVKEEVLNDVDLAIEVAKKVNGVDAKQIYLYGHSLGGMLVPKVAESKSEVKGIIISAAPARILTDIMVDQNKAAVARLNDTSATIQNELTKAIKMLDATRISSLDGIKADSLIVGLPASYWVSLNTIDQVGITQKLKKKVLVIHGGNDFQVGKIDFDIWEKQLSNQKLATTKFYPDLNHLLSEQSEMGTTAQYQVPANVSEQLIKDIAAWIKLK
ncbi:MAG: DUF3887 domain-containing protein [Pedobacter sp.]|nr:MAG: DUF3887 domain-containing protein [Pedobacter sp.]